MIIPKDHKLIIKNSSIKFSDGGQLISFSPIFVEGEKQNPVKITSDTIKNGNGIFEPELGETDSQDNDTDNDGLEDGDEILRNTDPLNTDSDNCLLYTSDAADE